MDPGVDVDDMQVEQTGAAWATDVRNFFASAVDRGRGSVDPGGFVLRLQWSRILVPFIWMAASSADHDDWPRVIADLGDGAGSGDGCDLGPDGIRNCWGQLRAAFRAWGIGSMDDLRTFLSASQPLVVQWARQDSRHAGTTIMDAHFQVVRGAYLQNFIQEWILLQMDSAVGLGFSTVLGAALHSALMRRVSTGAADSDDIAPLLRGGRRASCRDHRSTAGRPLVDSQ